MIFFLYICVCSRSSWQARRRSGLGHATRASQKHLAITSLSPPSLSSSGTYQKNPVLFFLFLFRASFSFLIRTHSNCTLGLELFNWTVHIGAANYAYPFAPHMFMHRYILINIWSVENEASEFLCICSPFNSQHVRRCFNFVFHSFLFFPALCTVWCDLRVHIYVLAVVSRSTELSIMERLLNWSWSSLNMATRKISLRLNFSRYTWYMHVASVLFVRVYRDVMARTFFWRRAIEIMHACT